MMFRDDREATNTQADRQGQVSGQTQRCSSPARSHAGPPFRGPHSQAPLLLRPDNRDTMVKKEASLTLTYPPTNNSHHQQPPPETSHNIHSHPSNTRAAPHTERKNYVRSSAHWIRLRS